MLSLDKNPQGGKCFWIMTFKNSQANFSDVQHDILKGNVKVIPQDKKPNITNCFLTREEALKSLQGVILAKSASQGGAKKGYIIEVNLPISEFIALCSSPQAISSKPSITFGEVMEYVRDLNGAKIRIASDIQHPPITDLSVDKSCFICDNKATTIEHIIPQWLQRRFNLSNQEFELANGKKLKYCFATIPACENCNSNIWSPLEQRISNAGNIMPSEFDIWSWAIKIHYGLNSNDKRLFWGKSDEKVKIGDIINTEDPLNKAKFCLHCLTGNFVTEPSPFGSVFTFKFSQPQDYHFIHDQATSSICISTGTTGFVIFVQDGQLLKTDKSFQEFYGKYNKPCTLHDMLFFYANAFYFVSRHRFGYNLVLTPRLGGKLVKVDFTCRESKAFNPSVFQSVCNQLGLTWVDEQSGLIPPPVPTAKLKPS